MADEQESVAQVEAETPIEQGQPEEPLNLQEAPEAEPEAPTAETIETPEPDEDFEDFDWNGKQIRAPKGLKDGVLMHADYTKKTQEVAATKKELEAERTRIAQQAKASEEELSARATVVSLDSALKQYENVDWDRWEQEDPIAAQQGWRRYQSMTQQKQAAVNDLAAKQYTRTEQAKQETANRLQETAEYAKKLPGWTAEVGGEIRELAEKQWGIPFETLQENITPQFYDILYHARIGLRALQKQSTAPKIQQPPTKPLTVVGAKTNAPVAKSLADMDMDEYVAARQKQMAQGR